MQESSNMPPTATVSLSEKVSATALTSSGITFPLWIDYFDHWFKFFITVIYLIVAIYTLQKQVTLSGIKVLTLVNKYPIKLEHADVLLYGQIYHIREVYFLRIHLAPLDTAQGDIYFVIHQK